MSARPVITLTTDFGCADPFVGVMKGVILGICPAAEIVDLTHGIPSHDVRTAAFALGMNYRFFPKGTIHVVVVDPGVGSARRPILAVTDDYCCVGPDNGVFSFVYQREGEAVRVFHLTAERFFLNRESPTFQGRDVFAPVAAWLGTGLSPREMGALISDAVTIDLPRPQGGEGRVQGEIIAIDKFGNALTNIGREDIDALLRETPGEGLRASLQGREVLLRRIYGEAEEDELAALINSSGYLEFFVREGSAAGLFGIRQGDPASVSIVGK